jgi:hypothetical protein
VGVTGEAPGEPTLAEVAALFPLWECTRGISGLCYARHTVTGQRACGEDPLDLRDQVKAAESRRAWQTSL